jgi:hypothetical protein
MSNDYKYKYIKYKLKYLKVSEELKNIKEHNINNTNNTNNTKDNIIKQEFQYVKPCSGGCYLLDW